MLSKRYGGGKERRGTIPNQTSIEERPEASEARDEPGADWEGDLIIGSKHKQAIVCLLYTSPSPRDRQKSRMPSSA